MRLPPPLATPAVVAVALAGTGLMQPAQQPPAQAAVVLPTAIHDGLLLQAQDGIDTDGRPLTVVQLIEVLAREQT